MCSHPSTTLPTFLSEEFEGGVGAGNWRVVVGGTVSSACSAGGAGDAMHFSGSCSRYMETTDLDLQDAHYIQFLIRSSCSDYKSSQFSSGMLQSSNSQLNFISQQYEPKSSYQSRSPKSTDGIIMTYQEPDLESNTNIYRSSRSRRSVVSPEQKPWTSFEPSYERSFNSFEIQDRNGELNNQSKILVQVTCDGGVTWTTLKAMSPHHFNTPKYVWLEIPEGLHCKAGRVRWWQVAGLPLTALPFPPTPQPDWALDSVVIGGSRSGPPATLDAPSADDYTPPDWIMMYNTGRGRYCKSKEEALTAKSGFSVPAVAQTSDIKIVGNTSLHFEIAIGCDAAWDKSLPPVRVEFSLDHGYSWTLVRSTCLPGDSSCLQLDDSSVFYGPLTWTRIVYPLYNVGPAKYVRFRWIQEPTADPQATHEWSLRRVYIGTACPHHCLGRGYCMNALCYCDDQYTGLHCQYLLQDNIPYIRDTFPGPQFKSHWAHVMGGVHSGGCDDIIEEPPAVTLEGRNTRSLTTVPVDTRSAKFVLFTAVIGGRRDGKSPKMALGGRPEQQADVCRPPDSRMHNVFLQYSVDGGITWQLLRELDHVRYAAPQDDYVLIPPNARSSTTLFRFWQPRQSPPAPSWTLDNVFIGGSEISHAQLIEDFHDEPQVSQWLFAPHSRPSSNYCSSNTSALVWPQHSPGMRAITSQELIVRHDTLLQFKNLALNYVKGPQRSCFNSENIRLVMLNTINVSTTAGGWREHLLFVRTYFCKFRARGSLLYPPSPSTTPL
ncbi:Sialidase [Trinorchestia longiramus]|nr:Sialidase [Trinorchestia longiramus]